LTDVIALTQQRLQIYSQYSSAKNAAVIPYIPDVPRIDAGKTMGQVNAITRALQEELSHKQTLQAWDLALIVGMQRSFSGEIGTFTTDYGALAGQSIPYNINTRTSTSALLSFSYNINMEPYKRKLADSVTSMMKLQQQQNDGLMHQVQVLQKSISQNLEIQKNSLVQINKQINHLSADLQRLKKFDSIQALKMRSQISISLAILIMENHLTALRIKLLSAK
jgi:hypothetical protein